MHTERLHKSETEYRSYYSHTSVWRRIRREEGSETDRKYKKKTKGGGVWCVWCERSEALRCRLIPSSCFISFSLAVMVVSQTQTDFQMWPLTKARARTHRKTHADKLPHLSPFSGSRLCRYVRFRLSSFSSFAFFQAELRLPVFKLSSSAIWSTLLALISMTGHSHLVF